MIYHLEIELHFFYKMQGEEILDLLFTKKIHLVYGFVLLSYEGT